MKYRTIKDPAQPPENITIRQAREAAKSAKASRHAGKFAERFIREHPETFTDLANR